MKLPHSLISLNNPVPPIKSRIGIEPQGGNDSLCAGFTLIEMLVVAAIVVFIGTGLIAGFSRSRVNIDQGVSIVMTAIREAQAKAVSSATYTGYNPCGYGFHYIAPGQFAIYAGPNAALVNCDAINKNYQAGEDTLLATRVFPDSKIQFAASFNDVFFLPPDPKTYINNNASLNQSPLSIMIKPVSGTCPQNCKTINVYPSGKIEIQ